MEDLKRLLMYVNAVTAPHRHRSKISKKDLDRLSNFQIDLEAKNKIFFKDKELVKFYDRTYPKNCPYCSSETKSGKYTDANFGDITLDIVSVYCSNLDCGCVLDTFDY